jgi:hypothetical protein
LAVANSKRVALQVARPRPPGGAPARASAWFRHRGVFLGLADIFRIRRLTNLVDHRLVLRKFLDRVFGELDGFLDHEHYPDEIQRVTSRGLPSSRQLTRLVDDPLDFLKCLGTINAVRRIFDFFPAEDSDCRSASDPYLKVGHVRPRHHRMSAMPCEIGCGEVPSYCPHAFYDRALDGLDPLLEIVFGLHGLLSRGSPFATLS